MSHIRARSNAELLDAAFEIYRRHFPLLFTIAVIGLAPVTLATLFQPGQPAAAPFVYFPLAIIGGLFNLFIEAALIVAVSQVYLGREIDVASAFRGGLRHPGRVFLATLIKALVIGFGFVALIVPGVFMFIRYFAVPATVVLEDQTTLDGARRSRELSKGSGKRILATLGVTWIFYLILSGIITATSQGVLGHSVAAVVLRLAVTGMIYPLIPIVSTLLYYDARIRKEGYDIELMATGLDANAAVA